jgi:hypothetical protein
MNIFKTVFGLLSCSFVTVHVSVLKTIYILTSLVCDKKININSTYVLVLFISLLRKLDNIYFKEEIKY